MKHTTIVIFTMYYPIKIKESSVIILILSTCNLRLP